MCEINYLWWFKWVVELPPELTRAHITPLFKKGDSNQATNYRGLGIASNITKLINKVVTARIMTHLGNNDLRFYN